jgi:small subunit ribosomal protein S1
VSVDAIDENNGESESFADLLESHSDRMNEDIQVGDKVKGEIISIARETVFVDTGTKVDGFVDKDELLNEDGELPYTEGDILELYVVSRNESELRLSRALSGIGGIAVLEDAFEKQVPVEGKVKDQIKGGFHVTIMQRRAFCPISQMDLKFIENLEDYVGKTYQFLITEIEEDGKNIVISRRELLSREQEKARQKFLEDVAVGSDLQGRVTKLMDFGAFVELFPGLEGMAHISELSWSRVEKPHEVLNVGDVVPVKVINIEQGERPNHMKIALSIKQVTGDPWESVHEHFHEGDRITGRVTRCKDFGAFVEIAPGVEGLVHISELSYTMRVLKPEDIVKVSETVPVIVKEIDAARRRISLSIRDVEGDPWMNVPEKYRVGQSLEGTIEKKDRFGYFVSLEPGINGLLPKSEIKRASQPGFIEKMRQGDRIVVTIEAIKPEMRRITLGPGDLRDEGEWQRFADQTKAPLGSLGEKLQQALKSKKDTS